MSNELSIKATHPVSASIVVEADGYKPEFLAFPPNADMNGFDRIDTVILLFLDYEPYAQLGLICGEPSEPPQPPAIAKTRGIPLANVRIGNLFVVIRDDDIELVAEGES
jgi:hypothetical protein